MSITLTNLTDDAIKAAYATLANRELTTRGLKTIERHDGGSLPGKVSFRWVRSSLTLSV